MERRITDFHQDDEGTWVAELECGHQQHVRHEPPWQVRPWVVTPEGRTGRLGTSLECRLCDADRAAEQAYRDARLQGLCHDGAMEAARVRRATPDRRGS